MVLPLGGHDLGVGTGDLDFGVQAGLVMGLDNVTAHDFAGTDTAVVWTLRGWEAVLGPAVWPAVKGEKSILLLQTEPVLLVLMSLHDDGGIVAEIVSVWLAVGHPGLAHDEDVVAEAERIGVVGDWAQVHIGVVTGRLACGGAVEIPFWKFVDLFDFLGDGLDKKEN